MYMSHEAGLEALRKRLNERDSPKVPTEDRARMADFVLKNSFFEFNSDVKQPKSGTAIGAKFTPPYACTFMGELETDFLKIQELQSFLWLRYIDDISFILTHGEEKLTQCLNELKITFIPNSSNWNFQLYC